MHQSVPPVILRLLASVFLNLAQGINLVVGLLQWVLTLMVSSYCSELPKFYFYPMISYWIWAKYIFTQKNPRIALNQMQGVCKLFERERIFMFCLGFRPLIVIFKPELNEAILSNSSTITKAAEYKFLNCWLGTGLLTSAGKKWYTHRKLLTPAFHFNILRNFMSVFNEQAVILTKKLAASSKQEWIDVCPVLTACTLDVICESAMGVKMNAQCNGCEEYAQAIDKVSDMFVYRIFRPWLWMDFLFLNCFPSGREFNKSLKLLHGFTRQVIKDKKEKMIRDMSAGKRQEDDGRKKRAFLELLLEHHLKDETFTEENIREEVDTFMFEGHDTTSVAMSWTLYLLGQHPAVQEKLYQEIEDIFEGDKERAVTSEDLTHLKYLECVIKEALRLYPPVNFIARELNKDLEVSVATGAHYVLPAGSGCILLLTQSHEDSSEFPNPRVFDPDRFLPENSNRRHPYAYIPFSAGPRNCIGQKFALMEEKTVIAHIVRNFKLTSLDPPETIDNMASLVMKNVQPIRIHFEKR